MLLFYSVSITLREEPELKILGSEVRLL